MSICGHKSPYPDWQQHRWSLLQDKVKSKPASSIGDWLPELFPRAIAPIVTIARAGYGSYDQPASTAYNSFSNRGLTSLERFPARFHRYFTTYYSDRSQPWMESHPVGLHFVLPYVGPGLCAKARPTRPRPCRPSSRQMADGGLPASLSAWYAPMATTRRGNPVITVRLG